MLVTRTGLEDAKNLVTRYKTGEEKRMTPDIWRAKKVVDATLHPGTPPLLRFNCVRCGKAL